MRACVLKLALALVSCGSGCVIRQCVGVALFRALAFGFRSRSKNSQKSASLKSGSDNGEMVRSVGRLLGGRKFQQWLVIAQGMHAVKKLLGIGESDWELFA